MEPGNKRSYTKYCIVPMCKNNNAKTPNKCFFSVPKKAEVRRKWYKVTRRDEKKYGRFSETTSIFCCEDHFILEEDTENYMEYKIMCKQLGQRVTLRLKKGTLPHIFQCQKRTKSAPERKGALKRRKLELLQEALALYNGLPQTTMVNTEKECEAGLNTSDHVSHIKEVPQSHDRDIQVNREPEYHSRGINTNTQAKSISVAISPFQKPSMNVSTSLFKVVGMTRNEEKKDSDAKYLPLKTSVSSATMIEYEPGSSTYEVSWLEEKESNRDFTNMMLIAIEKEPKLLLGLPKKSYYLIKLLSESIPAPTTDLLITLKKIKLNDSFSVLALHFGYSQSTVRHVFKNTIFLLAHNLKDLIVWPDSSRVALHLPIPFRAKYSNVVSIIDCLEIEIEKPTNALHQSLTWSQYKRCNTLKYLISCTPDGLVNFISAGYGGKALDATIVADCGYLEKLPPNVAVMAERRFKNISHVLRSKRCVLIRPPVSSTLLAGLKEEVRQAKQIAALETHVQRVIGRLKEFNMLLPHARTDFFTPLMDYVLITACGIINMQKFLTENQI